MDVDYPNREEMSSSRPPQQRKKHRGNRSSQRFRKRRQKLSNSNDGRSVPQSDVHTTVTTESNQQPMRASMTATIGPSTVMMTTASKTTTRINNRCKRKRDISIQDFRSHLSMTTAPSPPPPPKRIKSKKKTKKEKFSINPMIQINYRYSIIH